MPPEFHCSTPLAVLNQLTVFLTKYIWYSSKTCYVFKYSAKVFINTRLIIMHNDSRDSH